MSVTNKPVIQNENHDLAVENYKKQLDLLGVKYPAKASLDTLVALRSAFDSIDTADKKTVAAIEGSESLRKMEEPVRVKVICNNPQKRAHKGEFFGVGNSYGMLRAFVPYNCSMAEDMCIPRGLLEVIKMREYLHVRELTEKERRETNSAVMHVTSYSKEFTVIEL